MKPKFANPLERDRVLSILQWLQATYPRPHWKWSRVEPPGAIRARANRGKPGTAWNVPEDAWGNGVADILGIGRPEWWAPGTTSCKAIAIEVKRPGNKQSPDQLIFQKDWEIAGGLYMVARDSHEVEAQFKHWGI